MKQGRYLLILLGLCVLLFLPGLGELPMTDYKELRVVLPARSMAEGGDWLMPQFQGQLRLRKPPIMYWIVATAFRVTGTTESAFVARLPSAVMGTVLVLSLFVGGARLVGRRRAFLGACVAATSFLLLHHARAAQGDVALCLFTWLAVLCGYLAVTTGARSLAWLGFGASAGLGFMVKGPAAPAIPLAALAAFAVLTPSVRKRLLDGRVALALGAFALLAVPWYAAILFGHGTQSAAHQAIQSELTDTLQGTNHPGPFYFYLHQLPIGMLPWGLLLPLAVWLLWTRARHHRGVRFLLCWFLSALVILSLVQNKQLHYALLLLPPAALSLGYVLHAGWSRARGWLPRLARGYVSGLLVLGLVVGIVCLVGPLVDRRLPAGPLFGPGLTLVALAAAFLWLPSWKTFAARLAGCCLLIVAGTSLYALVLSPLFDAKALVPSFARQSRAFTTPNARVFVVGAGTATLEFYMHRPMVAAEDFAQAWQAAGPGESIVLCEKRKTRQPALVPPPGAVIDVQAGKLRYLLYVKRG